MHETKAMGMNLNYLECVQGLKKQEAKSQSSSVPFPQATPHISSNFNKKMEKMGSHLETFTLKFELYAIKNHP
jgi:hypothetical protein